ncbi:MAG: universal stress protein [Deltaproteobacteria bacterium]|nr:universal stress protein [Deltaproteobacteria bacterium]
MPIATIVVGCDLSEDSDRAIARAIGIALLHQSVIVLVHAQADDAMIEDVDNEMLKRLGEVSAAVRVEEAIQLADRLGVIQKRGLRTEIVSRIGPPAEVLAQAALEHSAELIVVGTQGRTGISRFLLGSVASETIRHAPCDVLVCRGPSPELPFQRPLVATDFSPAATKALAHAAALSAPGAPIDVVHAWQLPAGSWGATLLGQARFPWNTVRDAVLSGAKAQAEKIEKEAAGLGHPIHVELVQGPPTSVITHAAERGGHDLIAVGAHGHRGVRRLLLGSVAESTIRHSPCSVLVVHGSTAA